VLKRFGDWNSWEQFFSANITGSFFSSITAETGKTLLVSYDLSLSDTERNFSILLKVIDPREGDVDETRVCTFCPYSIGHKAVSVESLISPFVFPSLDR